ncbi:cytochrome c-554 precursor [mine drainage metagenome]|uniref:Cytochrome c-554 n=1 Tax=mine drainage metagenome TaxID=410659 RepID=A0A1J5SXS6_9ZZZZ
MFIKQRKKVMVITAITTVSALMVLSFKPIDQQQEPKKLKNIKVFPATATFKEVDKAMDGFKVALGVHCDYCHAHSKENPRKMDMSSDENPKKDIAREMMRMTEEMNKKFISQIPHADTAKVQMVTCNTCHRGAPKPFGQAPVYPKWPGTPPPPPPHEK